LNFLKGILQEGGEATECMDICARNRNVLFFKLEKNFTKLGIALNTVDEKESGVIMQDFSLKTNSKTRYIKVIAKN
jgi:hypothetical protein